MTTLSDRYTRAKSALDAAGQGHVLRFFDSLGPAGRDRLLSQIEGIDWSQVAQLIQTHVRTKPTFAPLDRLEPAPWYPYAPPPVLTTRYAEARVFGERLVRQGKVAACTVAGGQGTRLGWDRPKGTFPATPIRKLSLFACLAEYLQKVAEKYGETVPWYIMTSPLNDGPTRAFFADHNHFGLDPAAVFLFAQAMMPAIDRQTGRALLEAPDSLALSPDGHGGLLKALYASGAVADMKRRGIEQISYSQVDNPMVRLIDPLFLGLHATDAAAMSSKMVTKLDPLEKLGNFCLVDDKITVIEYSDLPDDLARQRSPDGELRYCAGSIAVHVIRVDFVESLNTAPGGFSLPFHRAEKTVAYIDLTTGDRQAPTEPNAVKLESFIFDALPLCPGGPGSIIYQTRRDEEFAPIKNADIPGPPGSAGAVDSPATSRQLQIARSARWLEAHGVRVPREANGTVNAAIEISHRTAIEPEDLAAVDLPDAIEPGARLLL